MRYRLIIGMTTVVVLLVSTFSSGSAAIQTEDPAFSTLDDLADVLGHVVHPDLLASAQLDIKSFRAQMADLRNHQRLVVEGEARIDQLDTAIGDQQSRVAELKAVATAGEQELAEARQAAADSRSQLAAVAISAFKERHPPRWLEVAVNGTSDPSIELSRQLEASLIAQTQQLERDEQSKVDATVNQAELLASAQMSERTLREELAAVTQVTDEARNAVEGYKTSLADQIALAPVRGLPFRLVVLDAYYKAQLTIAERQPGCEVTWFQLAAIGKVETGHGTYGGSEVESSGRTTERILGPELNGEKFLAIGDTDGGVLDGNTVWDHAVGPMQFIPSSWERYGADGDGDGQADPHNMYDAALAAGRHLCGSRYGLSDTANFTSALLGYNRSVVYGVTVRGYATQYAQALSVDRAST